MKAMYAVRTMHGAPDHGCRTYRGNGSRGPGAFTRGDRASWGETACGILPRPTVGLAERHTITACARPYADLPDARERPDTDATDGTVTLSGRFRVRSVVAASPGTRTPDLCTGCFMITCECGKW